MFINYKDDLLLEFTDRNKTYLRKFYINSNHFKLAEKYKKLKHRLNTIQKYHHYFSYNYKV